MYEATFQWPGSGTAAADLDALAEGLHRLRTEFPTPISSVGVAMPATLDGDGHVVAWPNRPDWVGLDLTGWLRGLFPDATVQCADDGDLAAIAEADAAGCSDLVYVGVGTGIGGGIVLHGQPCPGPARGSCELGHMVVDRHGSRCSCGRRGCVQAVASGPATLRRAAQHRGHDVSYADLRTGFAAGETWAVSAIEESTEALAAALVSACELVRPSLVVVGGGFAAGLPGYVETLARQLTGLARPGHPAVPVCAARLGGLSSLHGAVLLARMRGAERAGLNRLDPLHIP